MTELTYLFGVVAVLAGALSSISIWAPRRLALKLLAVGGATLFLRNETFIKWKPTVLYWLFGAVLAGGELMGRNIVRLMLGAQLQLPEPVWRGLSWSWIGFFSFMGAANLFVAYQFSTDQWVNFKLFGGIGLMVAFVVLQAMMLARYVEEKKAE